MKILLKILTIATLKIGLGVRFLGNPNDLPLKSAWV